MIKSEDIRCGLEVLEINTHRFAVVDAIMEYDTDLEPNNVDNKLIMFTYDNDDTIQGYECIHIFGFMNRFINVTGFSEEDRFEFRLSGDLTIFERDENGEA